jgi:hypothetical protein
MAFITNSTYQDFWTPAAIQNFTLIMYTEPDAEECNQNDIYISIPSADVNQDIITSDPAEFITMTFDYNPVEQSVDGCSAGVSHSFRISTGMIDHWNESIQAYDQVENWQPAQELFDQVQEIRDPLTNKLQAVQINCNADCFYDLQLRVNQPDASVRLNAAWITKDTNTNTEVVD